MCWIKRCKICKNIIWLPYNEFCSSKCKRKYNKRIIRLAYNIKKKEIDNMQEKSPKFHNI